MAVRLGESHDKGWASYNESMADLRPGKATAGNVSGIAGVAKIAGGSVDLYTTVAQEIATAGIATPVVKLTSRMGEAPGLFSGLFKKEAQNFSRELEISENAARRHLRNALEGGEGQAHHIIPWEARDHELIKRAAEGGFNINGANNGIRLGPEIHMGSHAKYNDAVISKLDSILSANPNISPQDAAQAVQGFADQLRTGLERTESKLK
jgi:hypothetical protein